MKKAFILSSLLAALFSAASVLFASAADTDREVFEIAAGDEDLGNAAARIATLTGDDPALAARILRRFVPGAKPDATPMKVELAAGDGRSTELLIRLPAGYDGRKQFPLVLLLHGHGSSHREMLDLCSAFLDKYGLVGIAPLAKPYKGMLPMMQHWWKHTPDGFPLESLKWARRNLAVDHERISVLGYSMGGFGAWNLALRHPDQFSAAVPLAGGLSQVEFIGARDEAVRSLLPNASLFRLSFAHGDADRVVPVNFDRESHETLKKLGIGHAYVEVRKGGHILNEVAAMARGDFEKSGFMKDFLDSLASSRRPGLNAPFSITAAETPTTARFVTIEEAASFPCRVEASVSGNLVSLKTTGVKSLSVLVDSGSLAGGDLAVVINGKEVFRGKPKPAFESVVASFRAWFDRGRVFTAAIRLDVPAPDEEDF